MRGVLAEGPWALRRPGFPGVAVSSVADVSAHRPSGLSAGRAEGAEGGPLNRSGRFIRRSGGPRVPGRTFGRGRTGARGSRAEGGTAASRRRRRRRSLGLGAGGQDRRPGEKAAREANEVRKGRFASRPRVRWGCTPGPLMKHTSDPADPIVVSPCFSVWVPAPPWKSAAEPGLTGGVCVRETARRRAVSARLHWPLAPKGHLRTSARNSGVSSSADTEGRRLRERPPKASLRLRLRAGPPTAAAWLHGLLLPGGRVVVPGSLVTTAGRPCSRAWRNW